MSAGIQRRRGTTAQHAVFTGLAGEITVDTDKSTLVVHDGVTAGGHSLATSAELLAGVNEAKAYTDSSLNSLLSGTALYPGIDLAAKYADTISSDYGGNVWAFIKTAIVDAEDFSGLRIRDYVTVQCTDAFDSVIHMEIAGINTYKAPAGIGSAVGSHIDFAFREGWSTYAPWNVKRFNNGYAADKFTGDGTTTDFQLTLRETGYPTIIWVTVDGVMKTATTDYTYSSSTGVVSFVSAPTNASVVEATWASSPIWVPFLGSNVYAYINSLKMGVPNDIIADPALITKDYTTDGIYYFLPSELKAVISKKQVYTGKRWQHGALLIEPTDNVIANIGPLWLFTEMEVFGTSMFATNIYDKVYFRQYPLFAQYPLLRGTTDWSEGANWWLSSVSSLDSTNCCEVEADGRASSTYATSYAVMLPGFRIMKT